jgi:hypothetical protein
MPAADAGRPARGLWRHDADSDVSFHDTRKLGFTTTSSLFIDIRE